MKKNLKIALFTVAMIAIVGFSIKLIGAQYMCGVLGTQHYNDYLTDPGDNCKCDGVDQIGQIINCTYTMLGNGGDCREQTCGKVTCCLNEIPEG